MYAAGFIGIYLQPHSYETASRWIFDNVPAGSRLVGPHWDDRLPLSLPGLDAHRYIMEGRESELELYEPDRPEKIVTLVGRVSRADYIVFPTPRLQGSVPRIPDEYPHTTSFIKLLWAERLGYHLEKVFKIRPSFLGFTLNDDLADESFSVYDHPKISIFKNVEHLSAQQIMQRVYTPAQYEPLPTMNEILVADSAEDLAVIKERGGSFGGFIRALIIVEFLGWASFVLFWRLCAGSTDRGAALTLILGINMAAWLTWLPAVLSGGSVTAPGARAVTALILVLAVFLVARKRSRPPVSRLVTTGDVCVVHILFLAAASFCFLGMYLFPGVFRGAQMVDAQLLSYFIRSDEVPSLDPAMSGRVLTSPYFGAFTFAWLAKVSGVVSTDAPNVCAALVSALGASIVFSLARRFNVKRSIAAMCAGIATLLMGLGLFVTSGFGDLGGLFIGLPLLGASIAVGGLVLATNRVELQKLVVLLGFVLGVSLLVQPLIALLALGALGVMFTVGRTRLSGLSPSWLPLATVGACALTIVPTVFGGQIIRGDFWFGGFRTFGLIEDSQALLSELDRSEDEVIRWLNLETHGIPTLVEYVGENSPLSGRIAARTGLPALISARGTAMRSGISERDQAERRGLVDDIYRTPDAEEAYRILLGYGVDLIFVGVAEREHYPTEGLEKFSKRNDLFTPIVSRGESIVYATAFSRWRPATAPVNLGRPMFGLQE